MSDIFESDNNYFQKLQWFSYEKIEKYNKSWNFSKKTDFLLFVFLCLEFYIFIFILFELNIIHFSQHLNAQDSEQIYLIIKNYDII